MQSFARPDRSGDLMKPAIASLFALGTTFCLIGTKAETNFRCLVLSYGRVVQELNKIHSLNAFHCNELLCLSYRPYALS